MVQFSSLDREPRAPTWAERDRIALLKSQGIDDVYIEPEQAPAEFWEPLVIATRWCLVGESASEVWEEWLHEYRFATGLPPFYGSGSTNYVEIVSTGYYYVAYKQVAPVTLGQRFAAIEHLMDVVRRHIGDEGPRNFEDTLNEKASALRIGIRVEARRFYPLTSEHLHQEVVQPALLLLAAPELQDVDSLYRKAFNRVLANDNSGAITAATSSVEQMLRVGLSEKGGRLQPLLVKARTSGWVIPAVEQLAVKLDALRAESDAHTAGTDDRRTAMFAIHVAGSVLLHLGETRDQVAGAS